MINLRRTSAYNEDRNPNTITDLTFLGTSTTTNNIGGGGNSSPYLCNFCDVALIKKMDDIELLGTKDAGTAVNTRFICPRCANIQDPLNVDEFNKLKHAERGQTIRSSSSSDASEGRPFAEMFSNTIDKDSLKGTQVSKALLLSNVNDPEPNEDSILRGQNMRILKTETTYPESGRKVVKTFD